MTLARRADRLPRRTPRPNQVGGMGVQEGFTRTDLDRLLDRIAAHEAAARIQSTRLAAA